MVFQWIAIIDILYTDYFASKENKGINHRALV